MSAISAAHILRANPIDPVASTKQVNALAGLQHIRVAVVHDWLTAYAGSERVLEQILQLFPAADLFTLVDHLPLAERKFLNGIVPKTSFLQTMPWSKKAFRKLLWLHPHAVENFDLSGYDLIISSSHAVAKGVLTGPGQIHICYCHSPIRYAWDLQHEYLRQAGLDRGLRSVYARAVLHYLRMWDVRTAHGVDRFIANSSFVARRINKVYGRPSTVVHPPVDVDSFSLSTEREDFYLAASRFVPYKRMEIIVQAFANTPHRRLIVVGDGAGLAACKAVASANVQFLVHQPAAEIQSLMRRARAFLFAAEEDFGITVVEAQACGTPVICYGRGGVLDSVVPDLTGIFFHQQTPEAICSAVDRFESGTVPLWPSQQIRAQALTFRTSEFRRKFGEIILGHFNSSHLPAAV